MRLLTNLCATLTFKPWASSTTLKPLAASSSFTTLHPDTQQSLLLHLHSYPATTPSAATLTKVDLLISALHPSLRPTPSPLISSEHSVHHHPTAGGITRPLTVQPDLAVFQSDHPLPLTSFVGASCQPFPDNTYIHSASALAACYNDIFSDQRFADPARTDVPDIRRVLYIVARAVAAALCTTTGCAAVTDGFVAVLLRVRPAADHRVCVEVTNAFVGDAAGALVALVEWAHTCAPVQKRVRECVVRVGNAHTKFWFDEAGRVRVGRWMGRFVERLLKACVRVAGVGLCGVVLESRWNETRVAVKYWNEGCSDGVEELVDEIDVYRMLVERFPHVVGDAVPTLIYYRVEGGEGVLVTEYVGSGLRREKGRLIVEDAGRESETLDEKEEEEVVRVAKRSLCKLHECGVAHGDVSLGNLRVERVDGGWKAWWIDLALADDVFEDSSCVHVDLLQFHHNIVDSSNC